MKLHERASDGTKSGLKSWTKWLNGLGVDPVTGWRWRRQGWVRAVNIAGRLYVSDEEVVKFTQRAEAGEFAKVPKVPAKGGKS